MFVFTGMLDAPCSLSKSSLTEETATPYHWSVHVTMNQDRSSETVKTNLVTASEHLTTTSTPSVNPILEKKTIFSTEASPIFELNTTRNLSNGSDSSVTPVLDSRTIFSSKNARF